MARIGRASRWVLLAGTAACMTSIGVASASSTSSRPVAPQVDPPLVIGPTGASNPTVSADGQYVVFQAPSADGQRANSVYLRDRASNTDTELSLGVRAQPLGDTVFPVISADGCFVVVISELPFDLFRDEDKAGRWDVYRLQLPHCGGKANDWELVSATRSLEGTTIAADDVDPAYPAAVSGTASVIAYTHRFGTTDGLTAVALVDLTVPLGQAGRVRPVAGTPSVEPTSAFLYRGIRQPSISDDGLVVAFVSDANSSAPVADWPAGDAEGAYVRSQVYAWERTEVELAKAVTALSVPVGAASTGEGSSPSINASGRYVAFVSSDPALAGTAVLPACAAGCVPQVYRYDLETDSVVLASHAPRDPAAAADAPDVAANAAASQPHLSADGGEVAYVTRAANLFATRSVGSGAASDGEIVLTDLVSGAVRRLSVRADGTAAPAAHSSPMLSANGRVVVFDTLTAGSFGPPAAGRQIVALTSAPSLVIDDIVMATTKVGFLGAQYRTTLINQGPGSFTPALIGIDNPDFFLETTTGTCTVGVPVPAGGSCTVFVTLLTSLPGVSTATLVLAEGGFNAVTVEASVTAEIGEPELDTPPGGDSADMGSVQVGATSEPREFTIINAAFTPVSIASTKVTGNDAEDFKVVGGTCQGAKLDAEATCTVQVAFTPSGPGERRGVVQVRTANGAFTPLALNGVGFYSPSIEVSANVVIAGRPFVVSGAGLAPNSPVTVLWADGTGLRTVVTTDDTGAFATVVTLQANERPGRRALVVQASTGESATIEVRIVPRSQSNTDD